MQPSSEASQMLEFENFGLLVQQFVFVLMVGDKKLIIIWLKACFILLKRLILYEWD